MKNDVNIPSKSNKQKNLDFVGILKVTGRKEQDPDPQRYPYGSKNPDPYQKGMDPEHGK